MSSNRAGIESHVPVLRSALSQRGISDSAKMSMHRNLVFSYVAAGWSAVVGIAVLPVYIRYLGIEAFGLIGVFVSLQAWLMLLDMGMAPTLGRELARFRSGEQSAQALRNLLKSIEIIYAFLAIVIGLAVVSFSGWLAEGWLQPKNLPGNVISGSIALMGLVIASQWMSVLYRSALLGLQEHVRLNVLNVALATLRPIGTLTVLAFWASSIEAYFGFQLIANIVEVAILGREVRRKIPSHHTSAHFSWLALKPVWRFAAGLSLMVGFSTLLTQIDKLLLANLLPLDQFGYFSLAMAVSGAVALVVGPIYNVALPRLTQLAATQQHQMLSYEFHRFAQLLSVAIWPIALTLCVFSREIVFIWSGDLTLVEHVAPVVSVWVIGTAINGLMHIPHAAQLAHGWTRLAVIMNAVAVLFVVPALLLWVPTHGTLAAAWIWVGMNVAYGICGTMLMHNRILKTDKRNWCIEDVLLPLTAAALASWMMVTGYGLLTLPGRAQQGLYLAVSLLVITASTIASTRSSRELWSLMRK